MIRAKWSGGGFLAGAVLASVAVVAACSSDPVVVTPTDAGPNCGDGSQLCGTSCTAVARDPENCGSCGKKCGAGEVCSQGACALSCGGGTTKCGSACVDTKSDGANCGACGTKCNGGEVCNAGKCATSCGAGATQCGSSCVNTQTDQVNCGACGTLCGAGEQCVAGKCSLSCQVGLTLCKAPQVDGGVSDASADVAVSDASGDAMSDASISDASSDASVIDAGPVLGATYCANLKSDDANCGGCGIQCGNGQQCVNGSCSATCGPPNTLCQTDGGPPVCANLQVDNNNCGGCGIKCLGTLPVCSAGACGKAALHDDGFGHSWNDANPVGTYTLQTATSACQAYIAANPADTCNTTGCSCASNDLCTFNTGGNGKTRRTWFYGGGAHNGFVTDNSCSAGSLTWR